MIRMKIVILSILFSVGVWADSTALFGTFPRIKQKALADEDMKQCSPQE